MVIKHMQVGQIGTNCYLFGDEEAGVCALVDPGDQAPKIAKMVQDSGMELQYILVTHGHFDHCLAVPALLEVYPNAQVYIHKAEIDLSGAAVNYMQMSGVSNAKFYDEGDVLKLGSLEIKVLNTPGHSPGSVVLLVGDAMFAGDTLFQGSCGRTDFAGGSFTQMLESLKRLYSLPGDYRVFPGHEGFTTLAKERQTNHYMLEAVKNVK